MSHSFYEAYKKRKENINFQWTIILKTLTLLRYISKLLTGTFPSVHNSGFWALSLVWKFTNTTLLLCTDAAQLFFIFDHTGTLCEHWVGFALFIAGPLCILPLDTC